MATRRRTGSRRRRAPSRKGPLALVAVFGILVAVNVYVFLIRPGNVKDLQNQVKAGQVAGSGSQAPQALPPSSQSPGAPAGLAPTGKVHDGQVQSGDTLSKLLEREGLTRVEANEIIHTLDGVWDPGKGLRGGQHYTMAMDDTGNVTTFTLKVSAALVVIVERDASGKLVARKSEAKTSIETVEIHGVIASSLYDAVKSTGESTDLVGDLAELFAGEMNFYTDTHEGDRFAIVVEKKLLDGKFWRYGRILAAEYRGKEGMHTAFWYDGPGAGKGGYFDAQGQSLTRSMLRTPLKYARLSSGFNLHRMHPVLNRVKGHFGTDFAAPVGTPVWAAGDARVVSCAPAGGAGNLVVLDHGSGLTSYYMHLSKFAKGLKPGQRVSQKQIIGYVGTTGLSTGPHLHLGVKQNGTWVDFMSLKPRRAAGLGGNQLSGFKTTIATTADRLDRLATAPTAQLAAPPSQLASTP